MIVREKTRAYFAVALLFGAGATARAQCPLLGQSDLKRNLPQEKILLDRGTGQTWALSEETQIPGAPRRMERVSAGASARTLAENNSGNTIPEPAIRTGDKLIAIDCRAGVEAHLEATALGPAQIGHELKVRTKVFGATLVAVAVKPGLVVLPREGEVNQ